MLGLVNIAKIAPYVLGVFALLVEAAGVQKGGIGILLGDVQDVGVEIAERRGK
jgi:hypothetical protein